MIRSLARLASVAMIASALTFAAEAATVAKVSEDALQPLRKAPKGARVRLEALPLEEGRGAAVHLEEFRVWAPDGKILVHRESGVQELNPPPTRYFRGAVEGDPQSFAFFSVDVTGRVDGLVETRNFKYALASQVRPRLKAGDAARDGEVDHFLTRFDEADAIPTTNEALWACVNDRVSLVAAPPDPAQPSGSVGEDAVIVANGISGTQSYEITLEIETDWEFFQNAGSNLTTATNYITNLTGALSTIYQRDLNTNVLQKFLHIYTTSSDPWTATGAGSGLDELALKYNTPAFKPGGRRTSAVVMLSGKDVPSGIAYEAVIGANDFGGGSLFGGPYSWSGGIGKLFGNTGLGSIPDPDGTVAGTVFGMPSGTQNYWPLTEYAHELGHNMAGHHTHCVAISDAERTASGFTDGSAANASSNFVDHCYTNEQEAGCYGGLSGLGQGQDYKSGSQTVFKGTIMSYCHNVFSGTGVPQSRFTFGVVTEPSQHQLADYMLKVTGPPSGRNIVESVGAFSISAISAPEELTPNSTGNTASITASELTGTTYLWSIINGTITAGETTNTITFTAGATGDVILTVSAYRGAASFNRVGITDSRIVPINSIELTAPLNFSAVPSGASVNLDWDAVTDATGYEVFRASAPGAFASIGTTTSETAFTDATAAANTAYLYKVRATAGAITGPDSAVDLASNFAFTDSSLVVGSTKPKLLHFNELLTAINGVRAVAGLGAVAFTAPTPATNVTVRRVHVLDLRTALDAARAALSLTPLTYTDTTITAGSTKVKAAHVLELRNGIR